MMGKKPQKIQYKGPMHLNHLGQIIENTYPFESMKQDYPWNPMHYQEHMEDLEIPGTIQSEDFVDNLLREENKETKKSIKKNQEQMNFKGHYHSSAKPNRKRIAY